MYKKVKPAAIDSPKKVLIFEGDRMTGDILSKIIINYLGCDVNIANGIREAMSFLHSGKFDLIIAGLSDNSSSILELIKKAKTDHYDIPVIIVTGDCADSDLELLKSMGIERIVYKPLRLSPFLEEVAGVFIEKKRVFDFA